MSKVQLISHTQFPLETIYLIWESGRHNEPLMSARQLHDACQYDADLKAKVMQTFEEVVKSKIPVTEAVSFTFLLEDISIALREQLVRHRIGITVGPRVGVDIVPDLAQSSFWSQSARVLNMGTFSDDKAYDVPDSVPENKVSGLYEHFMVVAQTTYNALVAAGMPLEEARMVLPMATRHRITWTLNMTALQHTIGKRGCWIPQLGLWQPILKGIVDELSAKIHPCFRELICPPCISKGCYKGCLFESDMQRRIRHDKDENPPCPIYVDNENVSGFKFQDERQSKMYDKLLATHIDMWGQPYCDNTNIQR